jgi:hypothetical protein
MNASHGMSFYLHLGLALATFAAALFFPAEEGKPAAGELAA